MVRGRGDEGAVSRRDGISRSSGAHDDVEGSFGVAVVNVAEPGHVRFDDSPSLSAGVGADGPTDVDGNRGRESSGRLGEHSLREPEHVGSVAIVVEGADIEVPAREVAAAGVDLPVEGHSRRATDRPCSH